MSERARRPAGSVAAGLAATLAPLAAQACAACAARGEGHGTWLLVGGLLLAPYAVVALVLRALRRAGVGP